MGKDLIPTTTKQEGLPPIPTLREVLTESLEQVERHHVEHRELSGVPTGFTDLDRLTSGLQAGNLIVIASRPSVGKTTLALDFARHAAVRAGVPTLVCSLELNKAEVSQRMISAECTVDLNRYRTGPDGGVRLEADYSLARQAG